jgi:hypothetical protein
MSGCGEPASPQLTDHESIVALWHQHDPRHAVIGAAQAPICLQFGQKPLRHRVAFIRLGAALYHWG